MSKKLNYQETLEWMFKQLPMYQRQGTSAFKKDLTNIKALCDGLDNPESGLKFIHVAGTNGKGSVSHIIAGVLQSQGYEVGMYTSPHYVDFRERIKINGDLISKKKVTSFIHEHQSLIEQIHPSFFEITVAMALDYFAQQQPDYVVLEVGLGGRLDSTNIVTPFLSVITNISLDHQSMLGDTIAQIAFEKGGIIKKNVPVVIGQHQDISDQIFMDLADNRNSPLTFAEDQIQLTIKNEQHPYHLIYVTNHKEWNFTFETDLTNSYQLKNLVTALAVINQLQLLENIDLDPILLSKKIKTLKADTHFIGRWQVLNSAPLTIADSAHNEAGINHLVSELESLSFDKLHIVIGVVNDKDIKKILSLLPTHAKYYFAKANIPRGLDADSLCFTAKEAGLYGKAYRSVRQAYAAARMSASSSDMILIAGSIFVVAEVL